MKMRSNAKCLLFILTFNHHKVVLSFKLHEQHEDFLKEFPRLELALIDARQ